jgi:hypothetical protein
MPAQASPEFTNGLRAWRDCGVAAGMLGISSMATSGNSGKADQRAARKTRLAAALRENLKRRKQQARQRAVADKSPAEASSQVSSQASSHETEADGEANAGTTGRAPDFRRNRDEE